MKKNKFSNIEKIISISKKGGMYILVDDENRENEGDLVFSASDVDYKKINFMAKYGRGLICLTLNNIHAKKLGLSYMAPVNQSRNKTAFTVSIEAKKGITTGISAKDRAKTIRVATKKNPNKKEIVSPGHVFPIIARDGGVLVRAGHTEASVDIAKLSNKLPAAVICEIMNEDGTMAKGEDLFKFAKKHKLAIAKIDDLISFRLKKEKLIKLKNTSSIVVQNQKYIIKVFESVLDGSEHFALLKGKINLNCVLVFIRDPNLKSVSQTLKQYKSKEFYKKGFDKLIKNYGIGAQIIKSLKIKNMILVTRSTKKVVGLEGYGIRIQKQEIIK
jgi:3,4-dihydroxy 2-butanone 4-phosphate synthase/GTP cyclohydrolase II